MTEQPIPLRNQRWPEGTPPVVSIFCITYNHEKFIRDAIEGFLMQETTFPVEIFVHDDASKDGTQAILKEYQEKYPRLFRMVLQKENQWSRKGNKYFLALVSNLPGEYIAFCEGDDYWVRSDKLQKQIEKLQERKDALGSFHAVAAIREGKQEFVYPKSQNLTDLGLANVLDEITATTCSLCLRNTGLLKSLDWAEDLLMGDWPIVAEHAFAGPLLPIEGIHAHYRLHPGGLWIGSTYLKRAVETERFYSYSFRRFRGRILPRHYLKRKENLLGIFQLAYAEEKPYLALRSLIQYLLSGPNRWTVPRKQKRAILFALSLGLFFRKKG